jgi:ubiquinol-cytochrome c reductase cytochrome b subunit
MRPLKKNIITSVFDSSLVSYLCPSNLNYLWNFGVLAGFCLAIQIVTGIFLAMHYIPHADLAFLSVEHIMRDVNNGWLLRYVHANGASMFFLVVYVHIFRGLFFGSFLHPRQFLWLTGVIILLLMILTAFMGYVLPWGQMSFWAATVITNLASAVPFGIGEIIVSWLWGGFAVDHATLNRFFSLHYLFPFVIAAMAILHIVFLHENGSNNPMAISSKLDNLPFHPYFTVKDFLGVCIFGFIFVYFVFFYPNLLGHSDNYIPANPLVTPTHIVPEWYFLPFYAMLRSIPNKLLGVLVLLFSIIAMMLTPFFYLFTPKVISRKFIFDFFYQTMIWFFFFDCLILGWIGGKSVETPFYEIGQIATFAYFFFFFTLAFLEDIYNKNLFNFKNNQQDLFNKVNFKDSLFI